MVLPRNWKQVLRLTRAMCLCVPCNASQVALQPCLNPKWPRNSTTGQSCKTCKCALSAPFSGISCNVKNEFHHFRSRVFIKYLDVARNLMLRVAIAAILGRSESFCLENIPAGWLSVGMEPHVNHIIFLNHRNGSNTGIRWNAIAVRNSFALQKNQENSQKK